MKTKDADRKTALVVEDEPAICSICRRVLNSDGFEVDTAGDGKTAKEMIDKKEYSLFLIDIKTPIMNGQELYQWLKEEHPALITRVIFTTGDIMSGDTMRFIAGTNRLFLPKPFTGGDLKAVAREAWEKTLNTIPVYPPNYNEPKVRTTPL